MRRKKEWKVEKRQKNEEKVGTEGGVGRRREKEKEGMEGGVGRRREEETESTKER